MSIVVGALFFLACFSIIVNFVYDFNSSSDNILATVYLFIHLIIIGIAFYFVIKAFLYKSSLMSVFMIDEYKHPILKSKIVAIVLSSICLVCGIYSTLLSIGLGIPLSNVFSKALKFAFMNVFYSVGFVSLFFALYPIAFLKENSESSKK